ncbi:hypothetical protein B4N89_16895 [Embleya scabrispora]|uniref:ESX-1 secretion-associated protein n=1 Tax=Embleya scabrispora TaxID=159449 RepID=A0A1T3P0B1_9ACTN|nr:hypothetical protein [Embleya scabrispora]OPC82392.1 hypothetical protein B4N89_16895 [Embleya scabrispora]
MAEKFSVDFAWLDALISGFDGSVQATKWALDALHETGPIRTGHKDLDTACDHFKDKWSRRVKDFQDRIGEFRAAVDLSKQAYAVTDEQTATSMSTLRSALAPNGSSAPTGATTAPSPSRIGEAFA